jgi:hypothetical protein
MTSAIVILAVLLFGLAVIIISVWRAPMMCSLCEYREATGECTSCHAPLCEPCGLEHALKERA